MKRILTAAAVLAASTFAASAADLGPQMYSKAPMAVVAPGFSWTGVYVGANIGGALYTATIDDKDCNLACSSQSLSSGAFVGGGQIGANLQMGSAVVGIEADIAGSTAKRTLVDPTWGAAGTTHNAKMDWFSTVRARAGIAVDRTLFYVTGGLALVNQNVNGQRSLTGACGINCFSLNETTLGIAAGAGLEYAFAGPWSAKFEYLYLGTPAKQRGDLAPGAIASDTYNIKSEAHILRVGANYRFGAVY